MAHTGKGKEDINISNITTNLYDSMSKKDEHAHTYDNINAVRSANSSDTTLSDSNECQTANTSATTLRSEVTVTWRRIVLAVIALLLLSSLISVTVGITVYHVTIAKMAESDNQYLDRARTTASPDPVDTLILKLKQLEDNVTAASHIWNEEIASLKHNISSLRQYSNDCSELYAAGTVVDGVYTISPDGRCTFHVYCDMTGGGWTLIQKRIDGHVSFNRSWNKYVEGFGNIDGEHWLGLDKIHRLISDGSEIYFHFEYFDGTTGFAHYETSTVHSAITDYRMNVDVFGYNGTIEELLSYHNNNTFSTYDHDNDIDCATRYGGGGWWYNLCYKLGNLNGVYGTQTESGIAYSNHVKLFNLKTVNIKVKHPSVYC